MVAPGARREAVAHVVEVHGVSQRRACKALGVDRSSVRYRSMRPDWSAPIEWSGLNVSAWSVSGLSGRCFRVLVDDIPERCAV